MKTMIKVDIDVPYRIDRDTMELLPNPEANGAGRIYYSDFRDVWNETNSLNTAFVKIPEETWIALDSVCRIDEFHLEEPECTYCRITLDNEEAYYYDGTLEEIASKSKSPSELRGEIRLAENGKT